MNLVLLADKKIRKGFELAVKDNPNITLLGVEMVLRGNTASRIAKHHNPHIVVIYRGVPEKDGMTVRDMIAFLRFKKPNIRFIYVYGKIIDTTAFIETADFLLANGITDIITEDSTNKVIENVENPMTEEKVREFVEELLKAAEPEINENETAEEIKQEYDKLDLDFPAVTETHHFDIDKIMTIQKSGTKDKTIIIGIGALQHHNGCTHTAFEIAATLQSVQKKQSIAILMSDTETYIRYAEFHKIASTHAEEGLNVKGIDVFLYGRLSEIREQYSVIICDFGYLREESTRALGKCDVKIMLCSAAEWDIPLLLKYVNYPKVDYVHDVHFCFSRVAQSKFQKYSKQLIKSGVLSYRLHNSPDWTNPHKQNEEIYRYILKNYTQIPAVEKPKRKLFRIKAK